VAIVLKIIKELEDKVTSLELEDLSTGTSFFQDVQFFVRWYSPCDHFIVEKFP
jgi:hypothetical protein